MKQFEIYIAKLDPTVGTEINKTRPVVIVSPNEINDNLRTVIIAPITSKIHAAIIPTRIEIIVNQSVNYVILDQIRTLDKTRLFKHIGTLTENEIDVVKDCLTQMFS